MQFKFMETDFKLIKHSFISLSVLISGVSYAQLCGGTSVILLNAFENDGTNWQLEFEDDFNSTTLNLSKWVLTEASQGSLDGTGAYNTLDNVIVSPET